jgi:signal transduction histidine kinase
MLIEASSALMSAPGSPDVLGRILALAKRFIDADAYSVWRRDTEGLSWRIVASEGISINYGRTVIDDYGDAIALQTEPVVIEALEDAPFRNDRLSAWKREGIASLITVPLNIHGEVTGTIVFYYRSPHKFTELETRVAAALGNLAGAALGTADLYRRETELRRLAQAEERKAIFLAEAGQLLSSSLDVEATLTAMVDLAVPGFADWASIYILEPSGEVRRLAVKHSDPEKTKLANEYARKYPPDERDARSMAMREKKSILIEHVSEKMLAETVRDSEQTDFIRQLGVNSVIVAPLVAGARVFGCLNFVMAESGRRYTTADQTLADDLARRAAAAISNARLFQESKEARDALERTNTELVRLNADLNQFAYSASHDLREPLRMIAIYTQMLERRYKAELGPDAAQYIRYIVRGVERMDILLRDLLAYTMTLDATPVAKPELLDLNDVAKRVLTTLEHLISQTGARVIVRELPKLRIEETHAWQLLKNLLENALKYRSEEAPQIEIGFTKSADGVQTIWVQDNGIGIDPRYADQIFGLFKRLHSSEAYEGTGLGLAICQKIVERYGGRIWVESDGVRGSTFYFTLPAAQ